MDPMASWTFPFSTCEMPVPGSIISQPYSFAINAISVVVLMGYAAINPNFYIRLALITYAVFEAFHAFSHWQHVDAQRQTSVIHCLGYVFCIATYFALKDLTAKPIVGTSAVVVGAITAIDLVIFFTIRGLWNVMSGLSILLTVFLSYWKHYPSFLVSRMRYFLVPGLAVLFGLFVNEAYNCSAMLRFRHLPYHALIEVLGLSMFVVMGDSIHRWEQTVRKCKAA